MTESAGMGISPAAAEHHRRLYGADAGADWRPERDEMALRQWPVGRSRACRTARDVLVPPLVVLEQVRGQGTGTCAAVMASARTPPAASRGGVASLSGSTAPHATH